MFLSMDKFVKLIQLFLLDNPLNSFNFKYLDKIIANKSFIWIGHLDNAQHC